MSITHSIITMTGWRNSGVGCLQSQWAAQLPNEVWVAHSLGFIAKAHLPADPERRATLSNLR